jgi:hypothetical protein
MSVDSMTLLKGMLQKLDEMGSSGTGRKSAIVFCEYDNEPPSSIKGIEYLYLISYYKLLKNDCGLCT